MKCAEIDLVSRGSQTFFFRERSTDVWGVDCMRPLSYLMGLFANSLLLIAVLGFVVFRVLLLL